MPHPHVGRHHLARRVAEGRPRVHCWGRQIVMIAMILREHSRAFGLPCAMGLVTYTRSRRSTRQRMFKSTSTYPASPVPSSSPYLQYCRSLSHLVQVGLSPVHCDIFSVCAERPVSILTFIFFRRHVWHADPLGALVRPTELRIKSVSRYGESDLFPRSREMLMP